jgi:hypothetical protein
MHAQMIPHLEVVTKILRYLKGTPGKEILIKNNNSNDACDYSDAD